MSKLIYDVSQDLQHSNMVLIGWQSWNSTGNRNLFAGCNVGNKEVRMHSSDIGIVPNLAAYLFTDDRHFNDERHITDDWRLAEGTKIPRLKQKLERLLLDSDAFIEKEKQSRSSGSMNTEPEESRPTSYHVPVVKLVVGGEDESILEIKQALENNIGIVLVNGSGGLADELAVDYKQVQKSYREATTSEHASEPTVDDRFNFILKRENVEKISSFGKQEDDVKDLTNAIFTVFFKAKPKQYVLEHALHERNIPLVPIIFNRQYGKELTMSSFLSVNRLSSLHHKNLKSSMVSSKILRDKWGTCKYQADVLKFIGHILHKLLGYEYSLLYHNLPETTRPDWALTENEACWHLLLYTVLSNQPQVAELLLERVELHSKLAASLLAVYLFKQISETAQEMKETIFAEEMGLNAVKFQNLAVDLLDNLYKTNRKYAYACLVSRVEFDWGAHITPLSIANSAQAAELMAHASCRTLLRQIWIKYLHIRTGWLKRLALVVCPFVLRCIVFDKNAFDFDDEKRQNEGGQEDDRKCCNVTNYYGYPCSVFILHTMMWLVFVGVFAQTLITELAPYPSTMSVCEILLTLYFFCIFLDELVQIYATNVSNPVEKSPRLSTCSRIYYNLRIYKWALWGKSLWNIMDLVMILFFFTSLVFRCLLHSIYFGIARILYSITFIILCFRLLRIGYLFESLGPRIISIFKLTTDMLEFFLVLGVAMISFGVAFQAILIPNQPASWTTLTNILWRPFWQMFGEIFLDDVQEGMDRDLPEDWPPVCTYNWTEALINPDVTPYCYHWMVPILLALYMLIVNILLLNLLIAIFSSSFAEIERNAKVIWAFHHYSFVHEYCHAPWLPAPLNIFCHICCLVRYCRRRRKSSFQVCPDCKKPKPDDHCILCEPRFCANAKAEQKALEAAITKQRHTKHTSMENHTKKLEQLDVRLKQLAEHSNARMIDSDEVAHTMQTNDVNNTDNILIQMQHHMAQMQQLLLARDEQMETIKIQLQKQSEMIQGLNDNRPVTMAFMEQTDVTSL